MDDIAFLVRNPYCDGLEEGENANCRRIWASLIEKASSNYPVFLAGGRFFPREFSITAPKRVASGFKIHFHRRITYCPKYRIRYIDLGVLNTNIASIFLYIGDVV